MPAFRATLHLACDAFIRGVVEAAKRLRRWPAELPRDGSLPGGHVPFSGRIHGDGDRAYLRMEGTHRSLWRTVEWRLMRPICSALPPPVGDLGGGDGTFGRLVRDRIDHGIEGDPDALDCCDRSVYGRLSHADIRKPLPLPDGALASLFANSVLQHVVPVEDALAAAARALRPGGAFVFTVPTIGWTRAVRAEFGAGYCDRLNELLGHHNLWSWNDWDEHVRCAGFTDVRLRGYLTHAAAVWYAARELEPWPQLQRRAPTWSWRHDLEPLLLHVRDSLAIREESGTTCLLVEATRADASP